MWATHESEKKNVGFIFSFSLARILLNYTQLFGYFSSVIYIHSTIKPSSQLVFISTRCVPDHVYWEQTLQRHGTLSK